MMTRQGISPSTQLVIWESLDALTIGDVDLLDHAVVRCAKRAGLDAGACILESWDGKQARFRNVAELLRRPGAAVEALIAGADLVDDGGLEVEHNAAGDVLAGASLGEEGVEGIITTADGLVGGHLTVGLDTVLEAEELPAGVTDLDTSLTDVD